MSAATVLDKKRTPPSVDSPESPVSMSRPAASPAPEPRVIDPSSRIRPDFQEQEMHRRFLEMNFKDPPKTMGRAESDYPRERDLGWRRFIVQGIDRVELAGGFRVKEIAWPVHYVLAPDAQTAEEVYRKQIEPETNGARRAREHLEVIARELAD